MSNKFNFESVRQYFSEEGPHIAIVFEYLVGGIISILGNESLGGAIIVATTTQSILSINRNISSGK